MKLKLILLLLCSPLLANAGAVSQLGTGDPLKLVYQEMLYQYQVGLQLHKQYDFKQPIDVMQCKNQHGYIQTRARSMVGTAKQVEEEIRSDVIDAAWFALNCSRCGSAADSCDPVPEKLEFIKLQLEAKQKARAEQQ